MVLSILIFDEGLEHPYYIAAVGFIEQLSNFIAAEFDVEKIPAA